MQTLDVDEEPTGKQVDPQVDPSAPRAGFWKRQFQQEPTKAQKRFDWIFGVVLPVACFFFDPFVFSDPFAGPGSPYATGMLGDFRIAVYLLTYVAVMGMAAWLLWREKLGWFLGPLAGLFAAGSFVAMAIGIFLFPVSFLCLLFLIGALGFTPFVTSVVYTRNAVRAMRAAAPILEKRILVNGSILTGMFALVIPYVINVAMLGRMPDFWRIVNETYGWVLG